MNRSFIAALAIILLSQAVVFGVFGLSLYRQQIDFDAVALLRSDARRYVEIADSGYTYSVGTPSNIAFFPAFPILIALSKNATGCSSNLVALLLSNVFVVGFLLMIYVYTQRVFPAEKDWGVVDLWVVFCAASFPASFFARAGYSESLFALVFTSYLASLRDRRKISMRLCLLSGLLTAIRPVGVVASIICFGRIVLISNMSWTRKLVATAISCWGILVFMAYQLFRFGDAFAFIKTQDDWSLIHHGGHFQKWLSLLSLEPFWGTFARDSLYYWRSQGHQNFLFNLQFANPIVFGGTFVAILIGWYRRWLTGEEVVAAVLCLAIPFVTRAYEMRFNSHARFCIVVIPAYLVVGKVLADLPAIYRVGFAVTNIVALGLYSFGYASGLPFY